jgi:hypothetical protein
MRALDSGALEHGAARHREFGPDALRLLCGDAGAMAMIDLKIAFKFSLRKTHFPLTS